MITLKYHSDSSHGWYGIKTGYLFQHFIINKIEISAYSYISKSKQTVYLEEDIDGPAVIKYLKANNIPFIIKDCKTSNKPSFIRYLKRFSDIITVNKTSTNMIYWSIK